MAANRQRILVVEDDRDSLELTSALLGQQAEVDGASDPAQALRLIASVSYKLLVTDLDIAGGGDGLILAGAMRYLQPHARTVLITGYPDFARALEAIQASLDLTLIKPVPPAQLRNLPKSAAIAAPASGQNAKSRMAHLLASHQSEILGTWLKLVEADQRLNTIPLNAAERLDHMLGVVVGLSRSYVASAEEQESAVQHGRSRSLQHYRPEWVTLEMSYLRRAIFASVLRNLLLLDLSRFPEDLFELDLRLDADLLDSLRAFGLKAA